MSTISLLPVEALAKAAFHLLASSTADRYVRVAREAVRETGLDGKLRRDPALVEDAIGRARRLWGELVAQGERDLPEVELAVWLAALSDLGTGQALPLLNEIARSSAPSALWLKGLSILLLKNRSHRRLVDCHVSRYASGPHRRLLERACT